MDKAGCAVKPAPHAGMPATTLATNPDETNAGISRQRQRTKISAFAKKKGAGKTGAFGKTANRAQWLIIHGRFDGKAFAPFGAVTVVVLREDEQQPQPAG